MEEWAVEVQEDRGLEERRRAPQVSLARHMSREDEYKRKEGWPAGSGRIRITISKALVVE